MFKKIKLLLAVMLLAGVGGALAMSPATPHQLPDSVYLMAYFTSPAQHLFYAWSVDGDWQLIPDAHTENVPEVKHGSVVIISRDELLRLLGE